MSVNLKDIVKRMLESYGIEILDRDDEYIWAKRKDGMHLIYLEEDREVDDDYIINFSRKTEQFHGERSIICVKGCKKSAEILANKLGIELTSRKDFSSLLGEYIIEMYEKKKLSEIPMFEEEDVEVEEIEEGEEEVEDVIPIFLEEVSEGEEKIIKPIISNEKALKIAREYVRGFRAEMKLIPYYIFEFSLELIVEGEFQNKIVKGIIAINALNRKYEIWKTGYETASKIEIPYERLEPKISLEGSKDIAKNSLKIEYTREGEFKIEEENITIIEKRKIEPKEESIKTKFMGLYYLPVWIIEGRNGIIMINAATGDIMKENIYDSKI